MGLVIGGGGDQPTSLYVPYKDKTAACSKSVSTQLPKSGVVQRGEGVKRNTELSYSNRLFLKSLGYNVVSPSV